MLDKKGRESTILKFTELDYDPIMMYPFSYGELDDVGKKLTTRGDLILSDGDTIKGREIKRAIRVSDGDLISASLAYYDSREKDRPW
jgi:hypothetical protein